MADTNLKMNRVPIVDSDDDDEVVLVTAAAKPSVTTPASNHKNLSSDEEDEDDEPPKEVDLKMGLDNRNAQRSEAQDAGMMVLTLLDKIIGMVDQIQLTQNGLEARQEKMEKNMTSIQGDLSKLAKSHDSTAGTATKLLEKVRKVNVNVKSVRNDLEKQAGQIKKLENNEHELLKRKNFKVLIYQRELRLVLLGWAGTGKSSVGNAILGFSAFETRGSISEKPVTVKCEKKSASVAGKQVAVVDTPDWFFSESPPDEVRHQLSLCESLAAPGPHAFLLCIPVHQGNGQEMLTLYALEKVFGPKAISSHTVLLFTFTDHLPEGVTLQKHLNTERKDLLELLERCGDHYHVINHRAEGEDVDELLEKVEDLVKESGKEFYTCPPLPQVEDKVERIEEDEIVIESPSQVLRMRRDEEQDDKAKEPEGGEERLEGSTDGLEAEEDLTVSPPAPPPSFLRWLWDWVRWLPSLVRGSTLLGSIVSLFFGGTMGATVGSLATEVGRRKQKTKAK